MDIQIARSLANILNAAADAAEAAGKSEIDLLSQVQAAADAGIADLGAAIKEAQGE